MEGLLSTGPTPSSFPISSNGNIKCQYSKGVDFDMRLIKNMEGLFKQGYQVGIVFKHQI